MLDLPQAMDAQVANKMKLVMFDQHNQQPGTSIDIAAASPTSKKCALQHALASSERIVQHAVSAKYK